MPLGLPGPLGGGGPVLGGGPPPPGAGGGPPGGTAGAMVPQPMAGSAAQGATHLRSALEMLQKALPSLPMGSEVWAAVHKALGDIGKHMDMMGGKDQAAGVQALMTMLRDKQVEPQKNAFMSAIGGGGPPPGAGAPPPGAGAGGPMGMPGA